MSELDTFSTLLRDWLNEHAWGSAWQREGIDLKIRSLYTCAMPATLGHSTEPKGYVQDALNNGVTAVEIRKVLLYSATCVDTLAATKVFRSVCEVLNELGTEIEEARQRRFTMPTET